MIPKKLHRVVPSVTTPKVEEYWVKWQELHPDWEHYTWRDPIDPDDFGLGHLWELCVSGAQMAGMMRLEILLHHGGVYVDSDLEPLKALDPLCNVSAFGVWEDNFCVPDFIIAAEPQHSAIKACIEMVTRLPREAMFDPHTGPWTSGPGVTTAVFPHHDVKLHPPVVFAPVHWTQREKLAGFVPGPDTYAIHHWAASWQGARGHNAEGSELWKPKMK